MGKFTDLCLSLQTDRVTARSIYIYLGIAKNVAASLAKGASWKHHRELQLNVTLQMNFPGVFSESRAVGLKPLKPQYLVNATAAMQCQKSSNQRVRPGCISFFQRSDHFYDDLKQ